MSDDDYIKATKQSETAVEADIHWTFDSPHDAGHVLAKLIKTLILGMERRTAMPREVLLIEILAGISCQIDDEFLSGDDGNSTILSGGEVDPSNLN